MKSLNKTRGVIQVIRHTPEGDVTEITENIETRTGAEHRAKVFSGEETTGITHIILGSGVNEADFENTDLTSPLPDGKVPVTTQRTGHVLTYTASFPEGVGTGAISELGLFSNDVLCNRATRPVLNKLDAESITVIWSVECIPAEIASEI